MLDWPEELILDVATRRSVLFLGAGVSKNAKNSQGERPKDWREYLLHLAGLVGNQSQRDEIQLSIDEGDLLTACELARRYLTNDRFKRALLAEYHDKGFEHAQIHDDISQIDSRFVLTTNFDKLYENRANQLQRNTILVKHYYDSDVADVFRRTQRVVLKVHGTIDNVGRTIFTRSQYAKARQDYAYFYELLRALFITHTFVFLGASLKDPDIQMLLEDHAYRFQGTRPHYIVMPRTSHRPGLLSVLEESMNLRPLLYDPSSNHKELADSVAQLVAEVQSYRLTLTQTQDW